MSDPEIVHTADGDPEYLAGALDRAERGMPLRPIDVQELGYRIGRDAARQVARDVESYARARESWAGIHQSRPVPLPPALARLFARLRAGHRLTPADLGRLIQSGARRIGRRQARRLARTVRRLPASKARAAARQSRRPRGRR